MLRPFGLGRLELMPSAALATDGADEAFGALGLESQSV